MGQPRSFAFTQYVRALEPGTEPAPELWTAMWEKLRAILASELRRRSLWTAPPSYLGICGGSSWSEEALEELSAACYAFVFLERLDGLKSHLAMQDNVEGLVLRSIRNFLYDQQKKHDPIGFRVFDVLVAAARQALSAGRLHVLEGDVRLTGDTVLGATPGQGAESSAEADPSDHVHRWNDELLPQLITGRGAEVEKVKTVLADHLSRLAEEAMPFRFKDVVDALKYDTRRRWLAVWLTTDGELGFDDGQDEDVVSVVRMVRPDFAFEEREAFHRLLACVAENLAGLDGVSARTRSYLQRLWIFVRAQVARGAERFPAKQRIAKSLDIPRYRLPELLAILGRQVERCRQRQQRSSLTGDKAARAPQRGAFP